MKNRFIATALLLAMSLSLMACGSDSKSKETADTSDTEGDASIYEYNASDYVTLGDYLGVEVELSDEYATDDEAFDNFLDSEIAAAAGYEKDPDATVVEEDSIVNLDYTGIKDGEPFEGGTAEDQTIDVAGNCAVGGSGYIDGFTSGLPGMKVGETKDCDVTFPENYGSAELAGQQVIFRFTINYICKPGMTRDDLTDDYVKENLGADSVESYIKNERESFESQQSDSRDSAIRSAVMEKVMSDATISGYPEAVVESRLKQYIESYRSYSDDGDVEKYIEENLGISFDEFKDEMRDQIHESLDNEMVLTAIADAERIEADDEGFSAYVAEMMSRYGATDEASFYRSYGITAADGEAYLRSIYRCNKAMDLCVEQAVIK